MLCARADWPSYTFRLPANRQSETIPRCHKAAVTGQQQSGTPRAAPGATSTIRRGKTRKPTERLLVTGFPQDFHTCGNSLNMDSLSNDDCYAHCEGTRNRRNVG